MKPLLAALALLVTFTVSGCSLESVPMPSQVSGPSYELKAEFRNALNLPKGAPVKLHGNRVGTVEDIKAHDYVAQVTLRLRKDAPIPAARRRRCARPRRWVRRTSS